MKDGFVVFYVKEEIGYPVAMTEEQLTMINIVCEGLFKPQVTIIDKPIGKVENLIKQKNLASAENTN